MEIHGRVFLVTGASAGIGAAVARAAHAHGAHVALAARRAELLRELSAELPGSIPLAADVTVAGDRRRIVDGTVSAFGRLDVLVNNAGRGLHVPLEEVEPEAFREVLDLNLVAPLALIQLALPQMRAQGGGAVVNISSRVSRMAIPGLGAYAATKAALNVISETARAELAADGIVVSNVLPTTTDTEFYAGYRQGVRPGREALYRAGQPVETVADAVLRAVETGEPEIALGS
jgi:short-subunit dehydrogenase